MIEVMKNYRGTYKPYDQRKLAEFSYRRTIVASDNKAHPKQLRRAWEVTYLGSPVETFKTLKDVKRFIFDKALN